MLLALRAFDAGGYLTRSGSRWCSPADKEAPGRPIDASRAAPRTLCWALITATAILRRPWSGAMSAPSADISFVEPSVPMALDGWGLTGAGGHTVDEIADFRTLPMQAKWVAVVM